MKRAPFLGLTFLALIAALVALALPRGAAADEGWVINTFAATIQVNPDGSLDVVEDISVDFGLLKKHGIFRYIPERYAYEPETPDPEGRDYERRLKISIRSVDNGAGSRHKYEVSHSGANLVIKIGDADKEISGPQRYRIAYHVEGALNPFTDFDELYWNVTGNDWPVTIQSATASLTTPGLAEITCFEGSRYYSTPCRSSINGSTAQFATTRVQTEGNGLTFAARIPKGVINPPPELDLVKVKTAEEVVKNFIGIKPIPIAAALLVGLVGFGGLGRYWWLTGRDRWYGDVHILRGGTKETMRPLFAHDTVVVEYLPPELKDGRRIRPAEIGVLIDERADTLDVSATIVDLAVRGYLRITEIPKDGLFGKADYRLERLKPADDELLRYEELLLNGLFDDGETVLMSDLKNEFYTDLAKVKEALYTQSVSKQKNNFFSANPQTVRTTHLVIGCVVLALGVFGIFILGGLGAAIVALPIIVLGLLIVLTAGLMPRRTGVGREMYRRSLGFREYMEVAETDRQRFYEEAGIFERYLPYAIVFNCTERWAKAFEGLEGQGPTAMSGWYVSPYPFVPLAFASNMNSFSSSISSAIASTPGGSGGSGFSGGGFSGGGVGGGGGGSW